MGRPLEKYPKRYAISFRVNDPDMAALRFFAEQVKRPGETFNETLGRVVRDVLLKSAEKQYLAQRERIERGKVAVAITLEDVDKRRKKYREDFLRAAVWARNEGERNSPERVALASPSVVAVARSEAAHTEITADWEATTKTDNLASPSGAPARSAGESTGKLEQFPADLVNCRFLSGAGPNAER